jgi:hypothetical protein
VPTTPDRAAVFRTGRPADTVWSGDCAQLCLTMPRATVEGELEQLLGRSLRTPVRCATAMDLTTPVGRGWREALRQVSTGIGC